MWLLYTSLLLIMHLITLITLDNNEIYVIQVNPKPELAFDIIATSKRGSSSTHSVWVRLLIKSNSR